MLGSNLRTNSFHMHAKSAEEPNGCKHWKAFLNKYREVIATVNFITVPTLTLDLPYF